MKTLHRSKQKEAEEAVRALEKKGQRMLSHAQQLCTHVYATHFISQEVIVENSWGGIDYQFEK